ncbi:MAG TPA: hypothetical protein VIV66_07500 [Pyrinomonadaceae bacterium]
MKFLRANRSFRGNGVRLNIFVITKSIPMVRTTFYGIKRALPSITNLLYCAVSYNPRKTPGWKDRTLLLMLLVRAVEVSAPQSYPN